MQTDRDSSLMTIAVDVGTRYTKIGVFKKGGTMLSRHILPTGDEKSGGVMGAIAGKISELTERGLDPAQIAGIGMSFPGPVTKDGKVVNFANTEMKNVYPEERIKELLPAFDVPMAVCNDANAAALGEMFKGAGKGMEDIVLITIGTDIDAGIIANGKLVIGNGGGAGEIGHMCVNKNETEVCKCGSKGCLQQYVAQPGLIRAAEKLLKEYPAVPSPLRAFVSASDEPVFGQPILPMRAIDIFNAADNGDQIAGLVVNRACEMLGRALAYLANSVAPEVILLGGEMAHTGKMMIDRMKTSYKNYVYFRLADTPIRVARLGQRAGMYGCDYLIEERLYGAVEI